ncbi:unnamed protein product [Effrenium voratum]|nr:unnamed protein product [Effrenium voratum]
MSGKASSGKTGPSRPRRQEHWTLERSRRPSRRFPRSDQRGRNASSQEPSALLIAEAESRKTEEPSALLIAEAESRKTEAEVMRALEAVARSQLAFVEAEALASLALQGKTEQSPREPREAQVLEDNRLAGADAVRAEAEAQEALNATVEGARRSEYAQLEAEAQRALDLKRLAAARAVAEAIQAEEALDATRAAAEKAQHAAAEAEATKALEASTAQQETHQAEAEACQALQITRQANFSQAQRIEEEAARLLAFRKAEEAAREAEEARWASRRVEEAEAARAAEEAEAREARMQKPVQTGETYTAKAQICAQMPQEPVTRSMPAEDLEARGEVLCVEETGGSDNMAAPPAPSQAPPAVPPEEETARCQAEAPPAPPSSAPADEEIARWRQAEAEAAALLAEAREAQALARAEEERAQKAKLEAARAQARASTAQRQLETQRRNEAAQADRARQEQWERERCEAYLQQVRWRVEAKALQVEEEVFAQARVELEQPDPLQAVDAFPPAVNFTRNNLDSALGRVRGKLEVNQLARFGVDCPADLGSQAPKGPETFDEMLVRMRRNWDARLRALEGGDQRM